MISLAMKTIKYHLCVSISLFVTVEQSPTVSQIIVGCPVSLSLSVLLESINE